ncbi:hypothetical protein [Myroides odoratus]|uniref:hypothetical protein n=1 Tax=Myroides odoratus TaxID=256 RepID=UPI00334208B5
MLIKETLLIALCLLLFSCSKSDDDSVDEPDVFSLEYFPIKSFDELDRGSYFYRGFQAEDRKASMLLENTTSCVRFNDLYIHKDSLENLSLIEYNFHESGQLGCNRYKTILFQENRLYEEGILFTTIRDPYGKRLFKGLLEFGFQGGYLRIEDKISNYVKKDPEGKVYIYFKMIKK